ncbi:Fe-S cluster assembly sulfur transfer protein SufU [Microbacterium sp. NPDC055683]
MSADLQRLYQELILDHSKNPEGKGDPTGMPFTHHELNPSCGDEITVGVSLDGERLDAIVWDGHGCSISMASASIMTGLLEGAEREEAIARIAEFREMLRSRGAVEPSEELGDAAALQGVAKYVMRIKCAMLGWVALEADLRQAG